MQRTRGELEREILRAVSCPPERMVVEGPRKTGKRRLVHDVLELNVSQQDLLEVDGSIDGARQVQQFIKTFPTFGDSRVVLVDGHNFSDSAQDAYLKICEDGTDFSTIIMIVDDGITLRPALLSRVVVMRLFEKISGDDFLSSVMREKRELADVLSVNAQEMESFHAAVCSAMEGNVDLLHVPRFMSEWSKLDDDMKEAVLAVFDHAISNCFGTRAANISKLVDILRSVPSANAEIHWWRSCLA